MDNLPAMQIRQSIQHALCDFSEDFFASAAPEFFDFAIDAVEGAAFAEFHCDADGAADVVELAIVFADMFAGTFFVESEFAFDLFFDVRVGVGGYDLDSQFVS